MLSLEIDLDDRLLADLIVQGRKNHKLTQEMLAERIGVDWRTVQRWEAGESVPWPFHIDALSSTMPEMKQSFEDAIQKKLTFIQIPRCRCIAYLSP